MLDYMEHTIPDIVVLDVNMPEMDGFTALASIKANVRTRHVPAIMLTRRQDPHDVSRALSEGAIDYLAKPFKASVLAERILAMLNISKKHVLVADDDRLVREFMEHHLTYQGLKVGMAVSGLGALEYAAKHQPDLILLDILLPGVNGMDVLQQLKADPQTKDIPVIMITAQRLDTTVVECLGHGALDFIGKPLLPEQFVSRVLRALAWQHRRSLKVA